MASRLIWHGDDIKNRISGAVEDAMNATLIDAVAQTKQPGWTPFEFGNLVNSITFEGAKRDGGGMTGSFGSYDVHYAIYQEVGTYKMAGRFYLRRAADQIFPTLPGRIAGMFR